METIKVHIKISPRLLDHLGVALYGSIKRALAELISNSYDARAHKVNIYYPDKIRPESRIVINDDGSGMSPKEIEEYFLNIAYDKREFISDSADRKIIGNKGIGKLAGFGIANKMEIITTKDGVESTILMNKEDLDKLKNLADAEFHIKTRNRPDSKNGTQIILTEFNDFIIKSSLLPEKELREYFAGNLPRPKDFDIFVNDKKCEPIDIPGVYFPINEEVSGFGTVSGFYKIAEKARIVSPGIAIKVRGRTVIEPELYGMTEQISGHLMAGKIVGEVNVDFLDPMDRKDLIDEFSIATGRDRLNENSPAVIAVKTWAKRKIRDIVEGEMEKKIRKNEETILQDVNIKSRLDKLPPDIATHARTYISAIIKKQKESEIDEIRPLIEWILKYYESTWMKELLDAIISSDPKDLEILSKLLGQWGLGKVVVLSSHIQDQIKVIEKLEALISDEGTLEKPIHDLFSENLWLLDDSYLLLAKNKSMKKFLEEEIEQNFGKHGKDRPDIVCLSDGDKKLVVVEFKRPNEIIDLEHFSQVVKYRVLIKSFSPKYNDIVIYLIGRRFEESVRDDQMPLAGIHLLSYTEVLEKAKMRYSKILKIIGGSEESEI